MNRVFLTLKGILGLNKDSDEEISDGNVELTNKN